MRRPWLIHLGVQLLMLLTACFCAVNLALPMAGLIGGVSTVAAPGPFFDLFEPLVCPDGYRLEHELNRYSYNQPGEYEVDLYCVSPDGNRQNASAGGFLGMLGATFAVVFLPLLILTFLVLGIPAFLIVRWFLRRSTDSIEGTVL